MFLSHAPTLLSLDAELESSISSLDQLSVFLTTFSNDLGLVSSQISSLEEKSKRIEEELKVKRALQAPLERMLKGGLVLDPKVVEKVFETEPDRSWVEAARELERSLEATRKPLDQLAAVTPTSAAGPGPGPRNSRRFTLTRRSSSAYEAKPPSEEESSFKALHEAREVVEATKVMVSTHDLTVVPLSSAELNQNPLRTFHRLRPRSGRISWHPSISSSYLSLPTYKCFRHQFSSPTTSPSTHFLRDRCLGSL